MEKFKNKYRVESARLCGYDYGQNGVYFITICTKNRIHHFGKVSNGKMELSEIGKYASECWSNIPKHFPFVELGEFVIMPNHVHGIIIINKINENEFQIPFNEINIPFFQSTYRNQFGPQSQNIASIIRGFKVGVTKSAKNIVSDFKWQARFHDHIVRNEKSFNHIQNYILNNPLKWSQDTFYN